MAKDQLSQSLVKVYAAILQYLSKAKRYYDRNTASAFIYIFFASKYCVMNWSYIVERTVMAMLQTAESNVKEYLDKISVEEANVDSCIRLMEAEGR